MGSHLRSLPVVFDRWGVTKRFVEMLAFVARGMCLQTAGSAPDIDGGDRNVELLGNLLGCKHAAIA